MSEPRLILAMEASNPSAAGSRPGVAVGRVRSGSASSPGGVEVLGVEPLRSTARHDDDLLPAVDRLWSRLEESGTVGKRTSLDAVAVSVGPGGFTGLRVAIAAAKMMAEALGAQCIAVPSASVAAQRVPARLPRPFAVLLASKRETTIATVFADNDTRGGELIEIDAAGLVGLGVRGLVADAFLPVSIRAEADRLGLGIVEPVFDPASCLGAAACLPVTDPAALLPLYGREPEAVRKWRELHGAP